jgi:FHS family L-fucose permease-like MFS transporter
MASTGTQSHTVTTPAQPVSYRRPLAIVALLFFIFGFLTCLNDILVPHLKAIFEHR